MQGIDSLSREYFCTEHSDTGLLLTFTGSTKEQDKKAIWQITKFAKWFRTMFAPFWMGKICNRLCLTFFPFCCQKLPSILKFHYSNHSVFTVCISVFSWFSTFIYISLAFHFNFIVSAWRKPLQILIWNKAKKYERKATCVLTQKSGLQKHSQCTVNKHVAELGLKPNKRTNERKTSYVSTHSFLGRVKQIKWYGQKMVASTVPLT